MTVPSYRGVVSSAGFGSNVTVDVASIDGGSPPSVGDLLLAQVVRNTAAPTADQHISAPIGWHQLGGSHNQLVSALFWALRKAGDSNSIAFTWIVAADYVAAVHCIRGVDQSRPIVRHSIRRNEDLVGWSWLPEAAPVSDCLAIATALSTGNASNLTTPDGWTERVDKTHGADGVSMFCQTQSLTAIGSSTGVANTVVVEVVTDMGDVVTYSGEPVYVFPDALVTQTGNAVTHESAPVYVNP